MGFYRIHLQVVGYSNPILHIPFDPDLYHELNVARART